MEITRFTNSKDVRDALAGLRKFVGEAVWKDQYTGIGHVFEMQDWAWRSKARYGYVYVKCEKDGQVVGLACGRPEDKATFFVDDIVAAPGFGAGLEMVKWFSDYALMLGCGRLALYGADPKVRSLYEKVYGFTPVGANRMVRAIQREQPAVGSSMARTALSYPSDTHRGYPSVSTGSSRK